MGSTMKRKTRTERQKIAYDLLAKLFFRGAITVRGVVYTPVKLRRYSVDYHSPKGVEFSAVWVHAKVDGRNVIDNFELVNRKTLKGEWFSVVAGAVRDMAAV